MFKISLVVWMVLGTALAGSAVIALLAAIAPSSDQAMRQIPIAVAFGFALAVPLSWLIARKIAAVR